jgi:hypothetical protein
VYDRVLTRGASGAERAGAVGGLARAAQAQGDTARAVAVLTELARADDTGGEPLVRRAAAAAARAGLQDDAH